jgi:hypothetical protein
MRSFLLLTCLLAVGTICVVATTGIPAALESPQVDDVTLLQMDATARTGSVAALETELAAALQSQQALEAELSAQSTATIGAQSDVDSEQEAEVEADSESEAEAAAALEAELEAEAEGELDAESETEVEEEEAAAAKHAMRFAEKKPKKEKKSKSEKSKKKSSAKKSKKAKEAKCPKGRKGAMCRRAKRALIKVTRSDPDKTPDIVEIPGKVPTKLYKSWVVNPNLVLTVPKPKVVPRHSRERAMTDFELKHYSRVAENKPTVAQKESEVRKAFLRLNPNAQVLPGQQLNRAYSPAAAFERLFREGHFPQLRFDPPTVAGARRSSIKGSIPAGATLFDQNGNELVVGKPSTTTHTSHHLTVRSSSPSVRQRAEVSALRSASRTLRRINAKRREYKRALRALRQARNSIQKQIHAHHVAKAIKAKKVAAAAQRRAAWSALLQHRSLRKELLNSIESVIQDGKLTGAARRRAIKQLIKLNVSPKQRAKLHAFIRGGAKKVSSAKNGASSQSSNASKRRTVKLAAQAKNGASSQSINASKRPTVKAAAPSDKDKTAVQALIARIRAAIHDPATKTATPAPVGLSPLAAAVGAVAKNGAASSASSNASKRAVPAIKVKAAAPKAAAPAPVSKNGVSTKSTNANKRVIAHAVAPGRSTQSSNAKKRVLTPRFAQLRSAEALAAEAEQEALAALNTETEIDDVKDAPLLQIQAQVEAAAHNTEELFHEYQL